MQCPNCGCDLKPGAKFCFNCGFYLDNGEDEKKEDISSGKLNDIPDDSIDFSEDDHLILQKSRKRHLILKIILFILFLESFLLFH